MSDDAPSAGAVDRMLDAVGPRLRDLREHRRMTLAEVGEAVEVSVSTLSRLESSARRPTLDLLVPLAALYRVALDDVIGAPPTGDPRVHLRPVRRDGIVFIPLTHGGAPVQAFKMVLPGRRPGEELGRSSHGGYEWFYVLHGAVELGLDDEVTVLREGEAAEFDTRRPHGTASASSEPAEILALFSPQGEQIHLQGG